MEGDRCEITCLPSFFLVCRALRTSELSQSVLTFEAIRDKNSLTQLKSPLMLLLMVPMLYLAMDIA